MIMTSLFTTHINEINTKMLLETKHLSRQRNKAGSENKPILFERDTGSL